MPRSGFRGYSRAERLIVSFNSGLPPVGQRVTVLCEDQQGKYQLPFPCEWRNGAWYREGKSNPLQRR
jgi:hypothetical protein